MSDTFQRFDQITVFTYGIQNGNSVFFSFFRFENCNFNGEVLKINDKILESWKNVSNWDLTRTLRSRIESKVMNFQSNQMSFSTIKRPKMTSAFHRSAPQKPSLPSNFLSILRCSNLVPLSFRCGLINIIAVSTNNQNGLIPLMLTWIFQWNLERNVS